MTHNFAGMAALRFISGACEAVADPCFVRELNFHLESLF